jgi:outer membrane protein assembly factor BamA
MQSSVKNRNGRVYPQNVLVKECKRYITEYVNKGRALGELNHPTGPTVNLDRVSHIVKELYEDGNNVYGKAKVLDTPMGKIVKNLIDEGAQLGVSTRGMGSLKSKNGYQEVQEDFMLAAIDIVADPSAPNAFVNGIMEGKEWVFENGFWSERQINSAKNFIKKSSKKELNENIVKVFNKFFKGL